MSMITRTKQNWTIGQRVNVGFVRNLLVVAIVPTPGNYAPDEYVLRADNGREYRFTPHLGLERIS